MKEEMISITDNQSITESLSDYFGLEPVPFEELSANSTDIDKDFVKITIERKE